MESYACPMTGEVIDSAERLAEHLEFLLAQKARLGQALAVAKIKANALVMGEAVTRFAHAGAYRIKVEKPALAWDQRQLSHVLHTWPKLAGGLVKVRDLAVDARGYDMIQRTSGDESFLEFRAALMAACRGRVGLPRVTVEKLDGRDPGGGSDAGDDRPG